MLTTLMARSSSHLSLRDSSFHDVDMQKRCAALSELRGVLESEPSTVEVNLAKILVLCSLESIMADNGSS